MIESAVLFHGYKSVAAQEATSKVVTFTGSETETFFMKADGSGGAYAIDVWLFGDWEEMDSGALVDGVVSVVTLDFTIPKARIRITTPVVATLDAEVHGEGAEYED